MDLFEVAPQESVLSNIAYLYAAKGDRQTVRLPVASLGIVSEADLLYVYNLLMAHKDDNNIHTNIGHSHNDYVRKIAPFSVYVPSPGVAFQIPSDGGNMIRLSVTVQSSYTCYLPVSPVDGECIDIYCHGASSTFVLRTDGSKIIRGYAFTSGANFGVSSVVPCYLSLIYLASSTRWLVRSFDGGWQGV